MRAAAPEPAADPDADERAGLVFGLAAYVLWGVFPLFFPLLKPARAGEILAQRIVWSLVAVAAVLAVTRRAVLLPRVIRDRPRLMLLGAAAVLIAVNWGTFIYAVNSGHVIESSLGYFVTPLVSVAFGVMVFRERLRPRQIVALALGAVAVGVLTVDYGRLPWIALTLAFTFGMYGYCKKRADVGAADSLAIETGVQFVPAVIVLAVIGAQGDLVFGTRWSTSVLLGLSGVVTAIPLLLFAAGTRRLPLSVVGLLQYLTPVLQFGVGVGIRHEPLPTSELIGFTLVWVALIVLTVDGLRHQRSGRRLVAREPVPV
jgi:chloramphenicol-sensitive protein RarD